MRRLIGLMLTLLAAGPAAAQVHKCVDVNGAVSYQDRSCGPNQKAAPANAGAGFVYSAPGSGPSWQENAGAYLDRLESERAQARERQRLAHQSEESRLAQTQHRERMDNAARAATQNANSLRNRDLWPRHRAKLQEQAVDLSAQAAGAPRSTLSRPELYVIPETGEVVEEGERYRNRGQNCTLRGRRQDCD